MCKQIFIVSLLLHLCGNVFGQTIPIGSWQSHYPYTSASAVAVADAVVYSGKYGLLAYNTLTNEYTSFSKVNGLSDINISHLAWEPSSQTLIITYQNSNIDLLKNNRVYNIPDLKNANIVASKLINSVSIIDNEFYLSTGLGILIIDPLKQEVKESYPMIIGGVQAAIYDVQLLQDSIVALSTQGIYKTSAQSVNLKDISNWRKVSAALYKKICTADSKYFLLKDNILAEWNQQQLITPVYNSTLKLTDVVYADNKLNLSCFDGFGYLVHLSKNGLVLDTVSGQSANDVDADANGNVWLANQFSGLGKISTNNQANTYTINGPFSVDAFNMKVIGKDLYVMAGGIDGITTYNATGNRNGIYKWSNNNWTAINQFTGVQAMDTVLGIMDVAIDPKTSSLYATSYGGGFMEINKTGNVIVKKNDNEITVNIGSVGNLCSYLNYDAEGNLWQTISNAPKNVVVKKKDGTWQTFEIPTLGDFKVMGDFVIDNSNQLWIILPRSRGVLVYNHNNTIDNKTDDKYMVYYASATTGNLASNQVLSIAKDQDGKIWIGTDNGVSVINCPESAFALGSCPADNKVSTDGIANGYLFSTQSVSAIAVDNANRKWIGTSTGVWLMNPDADAILERFTLDNSPLPSNEIQKITVDPNTGIVYFSTLAGLVAYRGTATAGTTNDIKEPIVFPNPIAADYTGVIAIKGLIENADVRITDISGKLVYRTKALGGQAIWNGKTYTGYRPNSGVFYVHVTNEDGSKTQQTKFVFMQ